MGFPIRKSADQSFFAAPHGLSQRTTSFIASQRQGIHQMPLSHLIALIINAHPARQRTGDRCIGLRERDLRSPGRTLIRKTSLSSDRSDGVRSSSRHSIEPIRAASQCSRIGATMHTDWRRDRAACDFHRRVTRPRFNARRLRHRSRHYVTIRSRSDPSSSRCQISRTRRRA